MTLFFPLPAWAADLVSDRYAAEQMLFAIPWDLNEKDEFIDGYCIVTDRNLLFLQDGTVCKEILAEAFYDFKVNAMSGVGILEAKGND